MGYFFTPEAGADFFDMEKCALYNSIASGHILVSSIYYALCFSVCVRCFPCVSS